MLFERELITLCALFLPLSLSSALSLSLSLSLSLFERARDRSAEWNYYVRGCVSFFRLTGNVKRARRVRRPSRLHLHARARACHSRRFAIFFSLPFPPFFFSRAHASFCFACRSRPRAIGYGNAFDPIFPPENVQRYRRGCRRASRQRKQISHYYSRC